MTHFHLSWPVDRDGYHLERRRPPRGRSAQSFDGSGTFIVRNGGPLQSTEPLKVDGIYRRLAECRTADDALRFTENFGFLHKRQQADCRIQEFLGSARDLRDLCGHADRKDWRLIVDAVNAAGQQNTLFTSGGIGRLGIVYEWEPGQERPEIHFRPGSLLSAIYAQALLDFAHGRPLKKCANPACPKWFTYGPGTEKRSRAEYCEPRCQKAHSYRKTKEHRK